MTRLLELLWVIQMPRIAAAAVAIAQHRHRHSTTVLEKLHYGDAEAFSFGRFQSPEAIKKAFDDCRSPRSFRPYTGKDGRKGRVCSTKLGGDWVLAESEQIAPSCTCEQVLRAYLDAELSMQWNADKIMDSKFTRKASPGSEAHYVQDLKIHSQRIIRTCTGVMRYSQRISVDKIGRGHCAAFVTLDPEQPSSTRKPFEALSVYVGLTQKGDDVQIYAAGVCVQVLDPCWSGTPATEIENHRDWSSQRLVITEIAHHRDWSSPRPCTPLPPIRTCRLRSVAFECLLEGRWWRSTARWCLLTYLLTCFLVYLGDGGQPQGGTQSCRL